MLHNRLYIFVDGLPHDIRYRDKNTFYYVMDLLILYKISIAATDFTIADTEHISHIKSDALYKT